MVFFSIIIPTYNRAHLITKTLDSILKQTYTNYEILIIDDGSTDNTKEIIKPYLKHNVKYYRKENAERAAARNFGTNLAQGDFINWFDSDDIMLDNHLIMANNFINSHEQTDFFHLSYRIENPNGEILNTFNLENGIINQQLYKGNFLSCNGVFVNRNVALENPFNESRELSASEDYELWLRLASEYQLFHVNQHTSIIIQHDERSVLSLRQIETLEKRFLLFIKLVESNNKIRKLLNEKFSYFIMKNYLILAVDLAAIGDKKNTMKYCLIAIKKNASFILERTFYAIVKHLLLTKRK